MPGSTPHRLKRHVSNTALAIAVTALIGCAETSEPDPRPTQDGGAYNMIDPVPDPIANAAVTNIARGSWRAGDSSGRPALLFGESEAKPLVSFICDGRGGILLERHLDRSSRELKMVDIKVGEDARRLAVNPVGPGDRIVRAVLPYNDPFIARLAEADGPIAISGTGADRLLLPSSSAMGRFVASCNGTTANGGGS